MEEQLTELKPLYLKHRFLIWPIFSSIAALIILAFVLIPQISEYIAAGKEIEGVEGNIQALEVKAAELGNISDAESNKQLNTVLSVLPADSDVPTAVANIQAILRKTPLTYQGVSFNNSSSALNNNKSFSLTFSVSGKLSDLREFIKELKKAPGVYQLESVTGATKKDKAGAIDMEVTVGVFYEPNVKPKVAADQKIPTLSAEEEKLLAEFSNSLPATVLNQNGNSGPALDANVPLGKSNLFE